MGETRTSHPDKRGPGKFAELVPHYLLVMAMFVEFSIPHRIILIFTDPVHQWLAVAYLYGASLAPLRVDRSAVAPMSARFMETFECPF